MTATQAPTNPRRLLGFYYNEVFPRLDLNLVWSHLVLKGKRYEGHPCPKCGDTETYAYVGGWNLICGHTNSCGHRESVLQALSGAYRPDGQHLVDAIAQAAHLAGVPMPEEKVSPEERQAIRDWYARQEILEATVKWAHGQLMAEDESAADARDYLCGRGVDHAGIEKLSLGLVPLKGGPLALQGYLKSLVVAMPQAEKMGLLSQNFAGFILFPWRDEHGGMLTIAGRWPGDPPPKSIHPGTFNKNKGDFVPKIYNLWDQPMSAPLYLDRARRARCKVLVIVEGLFDAALAQVRGDARVIATGTSLVTDAMAETIARQKGVESVVLVPDGDEAGQKGVGASVKHLGARGVRVYVAPPFEALEDGSKMDPARFILEKCEPVEKHGVNGSGNGALSLDAWLKHVDQAVSAQEAAANKAIGSTTPKSPTKQREAALSKIIDLILESDSPVLQNELKSLVKTRLGFPMGVINQEMKKRPKPKKAEEHQAQAAPPVTLEAWEMDLRWKTNKDGSSYLLRNVNNAIVLLSNHSAWEGVLAYDDFEYSVVATKKPPSHYGSLTPDSYPHVWSDRDDTLTTAWLQRNQPMLDVGTDTTYKAIEAISRSRIVHPVRDYLESLKWDETERIDNWLFDFAFATPTSADEEDKKNPGLLTKDGSESYIRQVGAKWLISAVARVFDPGCRVDTVLILEGAQGLKKSTAFGVLGEPWFSDQISDLGSRDAAMQTHGRWIIELQELDRMKNIEISRIKAFFSSQTDRYVPKWGKRAIDFPRQCIFCGTVNESAFLKDETGNRRFWPVRVHAMADVEKLKASRDQLWAEALVRYKAGEKWWLDDSSEVIAKKEQAERLHEDAWDSIIEKAVAKKNIVMVGYLLETSLGFKDKKDWTQADQNRVAKGLKRIGWTRKNIRITDDFRKIHTDVANLAPESGRVWAYVSPEWQWPPKKAT